MAWSSKVRSRQCKHNLNCNYNLMGFDTIEINLVTLCFICQRFSIQNFQRFCFQISLFELEKSSSFLNRSEFPQKLIGYQCGKLAIMRIVPAKLVEF